MITPATNLFVVPPLPQPNNQLAIFAPNPAILHLPSPIKGVNIIFVPHADLMNTADTSTITTAAICPIAKTPISATSVMATTLDPLALALQKEFNPLPAEITTPVKIIQLKQYFKTIQIRNLLIQYKTGFDIGYSCPEFANNSNNLRSARH